jgi:hypothetical protein
LGRGIAWSKMEQKKSERDDAGEDADPGERSG